MASALFSGISHCDSAGKDGSFRLHNGTGMFLFLLSTCLWGFRLLFRTFWWDFAFSSAEVKGMLYNLKGTHLILDSRNYLTHL